MNNLCFFLLFLLLLNFLIIYFHSKYIPSKHAVLPRHCPDGVDVRAEVVPLLLGCIQCVVPAQRWYALQLVIFAPGTWGDDVGLCVLAVQQVVGEGGQLRAEIVVKRATRQHN